MAQVFSQTCEYIFFRCKIAVLIPQFSVFTHQLRRTVHCEVHVRSSLNDDSGKNEIFWNSIEGDVLIRHNRESSYSHCYGSTSLTWETYEKS